MGRQIMSWYYLPMPVYMSEHAPLCVCVCVDQDGNYKALACHCLTHMPGHQTQKRVSLSGIELIMKRSNLLPRHLIYQDTVWD
jgi:hypothetical protein